MLRLHDFFFDVTERDPVLARVHGSNVLREIYDLLNRKAGRQILGCPHAGSGEDFVGLVGHDTNIANVGALLGLKWRFDSPRLPRDTYALPDDDPLPAGALVFELRARNGSYFVRIDYVTHTLAQMRGALTAWPLRLPVSCVDRAGREVSPCQLSLDDFDALARTAIDPRFVSKCCPYGRQACPDCSAGTAP
jgi:4-phytase/acid phosphatase